MKKNAILLIILNFSILTNIFCASNYIDSLNAEYENSAGDERVMAIYKLVVSGKIPLIRSDKLSLEAMSKYSGNNDLTDIYALLSRGNYFLSVQNQDSCAFYYKSINTIYEKDSTVWNKGREKLRMFLDMLRFLGVVNLYNKGDFNKVNYFTQVLSKVYENTDSDTVAIELYNLLYLTMVRKYNADSALYYMNKLKDLYKKSGDKINYYNICVDEMYIYTKMNNISGVVKDFTQIYKTVELLSSRYKITFFLLVASLHRNTGHEAKQKVYYYKALKESEKMGDSLSLMNILVRISSFFVNEKEYDSARVVTDRLYTIAKKLDNEMGLGYYYLRMLNILSSYNDYRCFKYADSALVVARKHHIALNIAYTHLELAKCYSSMSNFSLSETYFDSVNAFIKKHKIADIQIMYLKYFSKHLKNKGDYKTSLKVFKKYFSLFDSIQKQKNKNNIEKLYVEFNTLEKEKENTILSQKLKLEQQEIKKHKLISRIILYSLIAMILFFILVVVIFYLYRKNSIKTKQLNIEKIKRLEREQIISEQKKELITKQLQSQTNLLKVTNNSLLQQSVLTEKLIDTLKAVRPHSNIQGQNIIRQSLSEINSYSTESNWKTFELNFTLTYPDFMENLQKKYPNLTINEKRLCAFTKMKLSTPEICNITFQSKHSVYTLRKRLREKLGVSDNNELEQLIDSL